MFYLSTEDILTPKQYGFCPAGTTTDSLIDLIEEITATLDKGDTVKNLIAFVASEMLIALLEQIKSRSLCRPLEYLKWSKKGLKN